MTNPRNFARAETLDDGTKVTLRAVRRDDGPKIRQAFHSLEPNTVHSRFFGAKTEVSDAELRRITEVDFKRDAALLVTIGQGDREIIIGGASFFAIGASEPPRRAELAFTVRGDYQGRGIASMLLPHLAQIAREDGFFALEADVLADNQPMLRVFEHSGLPLTLRRGADVVHVTLSLRPEGQKA